MMLSLFRLAWILRFFVLTTRYEFEEGQTRQLCMNTTVCPFMDISKSIGHGVWEV